MRKMLTGIGLLDSGPPLWARTSLKNQRGGQPLHDCGQDPGVPFLISETSQRGLQSFKLQMDLWIYRFLVVAPSPPERRMLPGSWGCGDGGWDRDKEAEWQLGTVRNRKSPSSSIKSKRLSFPATKILHGPHNSYRRAELEIGSEKLPSV